MQRGFETLSKRVECVEARASTPQLTTEHVRTADTRRPCGNRFPYQTTGSMRRTRPGSCPNCAQSDCRACASVAHCIYPDVPRSGVNLPDDLEACLAWLKDPVVARPTRNAEFSADQVQKSGSSTHFNLTGTCGVGLLAKQVLRIGRQRRQVRAHHAVEPRPSKPPTDAERLEVKRSRTLSAFITPQNPCCSATHVEPTEESVGAVACLQGPAADESGAMRRQSRSLCLKRTF